MQVVGMKKVKVREIGWKYFNPLDSLNYLGLFPGRLFPGGKIQRSEQQLKQTEATSVKLKSCNLILHVPYLVILISDYTILREKYVFTAKLQRKQKLGKSSVKALYK